MPEVENDFLDFPEIHEDLEVEEVADREDPY